MKILIVEGVLGITRWGQYWEVQQSHIEKTHLETTEEGNKFYWKGE